MERRSIRRVLRTILVAAAVVVATGCGRTPITPVRIEQAIGPTFANLVHTQVTWLGLPEMAPSEFDVQASCRKPGLNSSAVSHTGSGDWVCTLRWKGPDRQAIRDIYDLFVTTDGCYTATVEGENLAGPTLKASDGRDVRNLLYVFEGCFDTTV